MVGDCTRLSVSVAPSNRRAYELWFEFQGVSPDWIVGDRYDAFMAAAFPAAIVSQETLEAEGFVSSLLCTALRGPILDLWCSWFSHLGPINIVAQEITAPASVARSAIGLFFSGGVDSFYTFLKSRAQDSTRSPVSHWVTAQGFDVPLTDSARLNRVESQYKQLAKDFGVELVVVRTNLRLFTDAFLKWDFYHGAVLAAMGLALGNGFRRFYIASATGAQSRWGSHAALDPLWSNGDVEFIHDQVGVPRIEKLRLVASEPRALKALRVCWEYRNEAENCALCEKCLRTMTALDQLGSKNVAKTFNWSKYPWTLLGMNAPVHTLHHWRSLKAGYPWSWHGITMKVLISFAEIISLARNLFRRLWPKAMS